MDKRVNSPAVNWLPRLALLQECLRTATTVSETGALLIMQRGPPSRYALWRGKPWLAEPKLGELRLVAREGSAPSTSGCRPDAMLFHHRAVLAHCQKLATGAGIAPAFAPSKGAVLRLDDPANQCGVQNAECGISELKNAPTLPWFYSALRIPHSALEIGGPPG